MLIDGDAIEIKKIESSNASLALNSSYPKAKLFSDSPMISKACKDAERWDVKDMIYVVGVVKENKLSSLCMVYGDDYCAQKETYERIKDTIKNGVENLTGIEFSTTKELAKINKVDPLGITYLRVRGMWGIENPFKVFDYVFNRNLEKEFNFMALINNEKYYQLESIDNLENLIGKIDGFCISDVKIKNPNNPAKLNDAKLISFIA